MCKNPSLLALQAISLFAKGKSLTLITVCKANNLTFIVAKRQNNGVHMDELIEIRDDLFDISSRIKSIDENYKIYFNGETCRYELHNFSKYPSFQAVIPYATLDKRALDFARKSRVDNIQSILAEIDAHNARLEKIRQDGLKDRVMSNLDL